MDIDKIISEHFDKLKFAKPDKVTMSPSKFTETLNLSGKQHIYDSKILESTEINISLSNLNEILGMYVMHYLLIFLKYSNKYFSIGRYSK